MSSLLGAGCQSGALAVPPGNENGGIRSGKVPGEYSLRTRRPRSGNGAPASGARLGAGTPAGAAHHGRVGSTAEGEPTRCSPVIPESPELLRRPPRSRRGVGPEGGPVDELEVIGTLPVLKIDEAPDDQPPPEPDSESSSANPGAADPDSTGPDPAGPDPTDRDERLGRAERPAVSDQLDVSGRPEASDRVVTSSGPKSSGPSSSHPPSAPTRSAHGEESAASGWARRRPDPRGRRDSPPAGSSDSGGTVIPREARSPCAEAVHRSHRRDAASAAPTPSPPLSPRLRRLRRP